MPTPGRIETWAAPIGTDVRVDTACFPGWTITALLRLAAGQADRARGRPRGGAGRGRADALRHLRVEGVETTARFALDLLGAPRRRGRRIHTRWIEDEFLPGLDRRRRRPPDGPDRDRRPVAARRPAEPVGVAHARRARAAGRRRDRQRRLPRRRPHRQLDPSRCMVRYRLENPWKGLDADPRRAAAPRRCGPGRAPTASSAWASRRTRSSSSGSGRWRKHGIGSLWIFDCLHDVDKMLQVAEDRPRRRRGALAAAELLATRPSTPTSTTRRAHGPLRRERRPRRRSSSATRPACSGPSGRAAGSASCASRAGGTELEMHFHNRTAHGLRSTTSSASRKA